VPSTLAAFLSGEATASQSAEVLHWAQSTVANSAQLDALRTAWGAIAKRDPTLGKVWSADEMWSRVAPHLDEDARPALRLVRTPVNTPVHPPHVPRATPRFTTASGGRAAPWVVAAACVALLVGAYADRRATDERARHEVPASVAMREYRTGRGQRASGTLPDGSAFQIGPLSALRISDDYSGAARVVELEGDGYFNVIHDPTHPFSVRAARATIHDVGTRFVVRARPAESRVEVAVAEGEIALDASMMGAPGERADTLHRTTPVVLMAGQAASVDVRGAVTRDPHAAVGTRFGWTRGELSFSNARVPDVLDEMSRWYGDTFVLADSSLRTVRLTTVLRGETLLEALVVLETALDVDARVNRDTVTLTPHHSGRRSTP
jgi:ferric-dicitrate binding protein FerR (iron transport regulator)